VDGGGLQRDGRWGDDRAAMKTRTMWCVVGVLVALNGMAASRARACSCSAPPAPMDALASATAVFEGYVLDVSVDSQGLRRTVRFQVLRAWKGVHADTIVQVVTGTQSSLCGVDVAAHTSVLVYAAGSADALTMALCSRTRPSLQDMGDFTALGTPVEVGTAAPGALRPSSDSGCAVGGRTRPARGWFLGLALLGLAAASCAYRTNVIT
jgi:hypothetical protein